MHEWHIDRLQCDSRSRTQPCTNRHTAACHRYALGNADANPTTHSAPARHADHCGHRHADPGREATPTSAIPTATPIPLCSERIPDADNLLTIVTLTYGISREYEPQDLVKIDSQLPFAVTSATLPKFASRLYNRWSISLPPGKPRTEPVYHLRLSQLRIPGYCLRQMEKIAPIQPPSSVRVGFSEHQLGTTVDFGSPGWRPLSVRRSSFTPIFCQTSEGKWLAENAHKYGWTLAIRGMHSGCRRFLSRGIIVMSVSNWRRVALKEETF